MGGEGGFCGGMINCCSKVRGGVCSWQLGGYCLVRVGSRNLKFMVDFVNYSS